MYECVMTVYECVMTPYRDLPSLRCDSDSLQALPYTGVVVCTSEEYECVVTLFS